MNVLETSSSVMKSATKVAWLGVAVGVFVGLHVAGALAKPLAGEVKKGVAAFNKGFLALRKARANRGNRADDPAAEKTVKEKEAAAQGPFKIPVEDISPTDAAGAADALRPAPDTGESDDAASADAMPSLRWLKIDLLEEARRRGIEVRQSMTKKEILDALAMKG